MSAAVANARCWLALESAKEWIHAARHDSRCATVWEPSRARNPELAAQLRRRPMACTCWKADALLEIDGILAGPVESEVAS